MKEAIATTETYLTLRNQPGLTLVMYDIRGEGYRSKKPVMAAFRRMGRKYPTLNLVYVDFRYVTIPKEDDTGFIPGFRILLDGEKVAACCYCLNGQGVEVWVDQHLKGLVE